MSLHRDQRLNAAPRFPSSGLANPDPVGPRENPLRLPRPKKVESPTAHVALFVDWENIRRTLGAEVMEATGFAARLRSVAEQYGRVLRASAYADWDSHELAAEFRRHQIEPSLVIANANGREHSNVVVALDAFESLYHSPLLDVYVIAAGSADYRSLVPRLRTAGRRIVLVAQEENPGREALAATDQFVPIETLVSARRIDRSLPSTVDFESYQWGPFILTVRDLERQMPFLGFGWLLKKRLNFASCGYDTLEEKQQVMDRAVDEGILYLYKVPNIDGKTDPVTACKLNHEHGQVKDVLARDRDAEAEAEAEGEDEGEGEGEGEAEAEEEAATPASEES